MLYLVHKKLKVNVNESFEKHGKLVSPKHDTQILHNHHPKKQTGSSNKSMTSSCNFQINEEDIIT